MTQRGPSPLHPEQQAARDVRGASVALSAGAGCGKTRVLMERYLGSLQGEEPEPLGRLIALTFTEKAALELRDRVRGDCHRRITDPAETATAGSWRAILRGLDAAPIGTFHSFCSRILQRFSVEAGLEPGFGVIDATVATTVRDEAISGLVRDLLLEKNPDLIDLAIEVGLPCTSRLLDDLVNARTKTDLAAWAARSVDEIVDLWDAHLDQVAIPYFRDKTQTIATEWIRLLSACHYIAKGAAGQRLDSLRDLLLDMDWEGDFLAVLQESRGEFHLKGSKPRYWSDPDAYAVMKASFDRLGETAKEALKLGEFDEAATRAAAESCRRLARLGVLAIEAYHHAKRARGQIDFDDQLLLTRELLRANPEPVARWLERSVGFVLVDEFQDTDPIQAEILRLLTRDRFTEALYLVGDIKQSIYRFRGAQPELFTKLREEFPDIGRKSLRANFRSHPAVLDFVNAVFCTVFQGDEHRLISGLNLPPATANPSVMLVWPFEPSENGEKPSTQTRRKVEARWLARLLASGLREGPDRWRIRDRQTGRERPAEPGDVAILFRTLNDVAPHEDALVAAGLDYYVVGGTAFYGQQEVLDLINVLSVIENPLDAVALAATLRGPFGGLTDNALYWLGTVPQTDLPTAFDDWARLGPLDPTDRQRAGRLHDLLASWRSRKDVLPIAELLDRVLTESGVEAALPADFLGDRRRANLRKLVRMARVYDSETGFTLGEFIEQLRANWRHPPREEQAATVDEHEVRAVRLMTIHQSKGLEFPIVVVPDLNRKKNPNREHVGVSDDLGIIVTGSLVFGEEASDADESAEPGQKSAPVKNLGKMLHDHREGIASDDEARRMFYVATTRARDRLILSAGMEPTEKPASPALRLLAECFDFQSGACLVALPEGVSAPSLTVIQTQPPEPPGLNRAPRPRLLRVARELERIQSTFVTETNPVSQQDPAHPRWIDVHPWVGLGPRAAREDALLRAVLAEPGDLVAGPERLAEAIREQARRLVPSPPPRVERVLHEAMAAWLTSPSGRLLREPRWIRSAITWTRPIESGVHDPAILAGSLDLLVMDMKERTHLIQIALPGADPLRERARLIGSALAAVDLGLARRIDRGWQLWLEPAPRIHAEDRLDARGLHSAIQDYLVANRV